MDVNSNEKNESTKKTVLSREESKTLFKQGMRDGFPIGLGYFAVSFSLGIAAAKVGLNLFQGFLASLFMIASAGEYAAFSLIGAGATYVEMIIISLITNGRYLLMSCALNQRFSPKATLFDRISVSAFTTDELFAIAVARPGYIAPVYSYGAVVTSIPLWVIGTMIGVVAGNILPVIIVSALSVAIYGMFLAIIIPPARENRVVAVFVIISFLWSYFVPKISFLSFLSSGQSLIIGTILLSTIAAVLFPIKEETDNA